MSRNSKHRLVKEPSSRTAAIILRSKQYQTIHRLCGLHTIATILLLLIGTNIATAFQNQPLDSNSNNSMRGAWKSQGTNQRELVDQLRKKGIIRTDAIQTIMGLVDRGNYCFLRPRFESESDKICYADRALGIGLGQTISAPHMHAYALEEIYGSLAENNKKKANTKILDVGCGSGYLTACFGRWLSPLNQNETATIHNTNRVFGIDVRQDLVDMTRKNMERADADLLDNGTVELSLRDGWKGLPEQAPFDAIHVGAAAESLPKILANQLAVGGVMIIPIGPQDSSTHQVLYKIKRVQQQQQQQQDGKGEATSSSQDYYASEDSFDEKDFEVKSLLGVRYVPLVKGEDL